MTNIFYTANGIVENMANVSNLSLPNNSVVGNKIRISQIGIISIGELKLYDENNIEIPKSNITITQSSDLDVNTTAVKAIDGNPFTITSTTGQGEQWLEVTLTNSIKISRIYIYSVTLRNAKLEIMNNNVSVFQYLFDNNINSFYNIYVKYNYVITRSIKILQPNKIWMNLNEISFFDETGMKIPNDTITSTQSSNYSGSSPVSNMLDNILDTIAHTNNGPNEWFEFKFASDKKVSRIILTNRPGQLDRIVGSKILFLDSSNKLVYVYTINDALPIYNIEINDNPWEVYQNTTTNKYTPLKKMGDGYYCMSKDGINCVSDENIYTALKSTLDDSSKSLLINDELLGANTILKKDNIELIINDSLSTQQNIINTVTDEISLVNENINKLKERLQNKDNSEFAQIEKDIATVQSNIDLITININTLKASIDNYNIKTSTYKYILIASGIFFLIIIVILLILIRKK
jgi:hypothetical protein